MKSDASALEPRLRQVLEWTQAERHADIGSDHAYLPIQLIRTGRVQRGIVVEKNRAPLEKARRNIERAGLSQALEVRLGDGLAALSPGEVSSLSLCGMGARTMVGILERGPAVLEGVQSVVLQPNASAQPLRLWARRAGYHLEREALVPGFWRYPVLHLRRRPGADPAYHGVPLEAALEFGPLLLRRRDSLLIADLHQQQQRLSALIALQNPRTLEHNACVMQALNWLQT